MVYLKTEGVLVPPKTSGHNYIDTGNRKKEYNVKTIMHACNLIIH